MNRKYTREQYLEKINRLRDIRPGIAISSDIIVGFPGETEDDFIKTRELINTVMYDSVFAFKYSDRPNAPASAFSGKVSEEEKKIRLTELLNLQESITREKNNDDVGKVLEVLVEGRSKKNKIINSGTNNPDVQWTGRTSKNKIVNFVIPAKFINQGDDSFCGKLINVEIEKACAHSIWGKAVKY
jgi:tRNA-2-methylthio-N6-dimethylallyladenosine synthase